MTTARSTAAAGTLGKLFSELEQLVSIKIAIAVGVCLRHGLPQLGRDLLLRKLAVLIAVQLQESSKEALGTVGIATALLLPTRSRARSFATGIAAGGTEARTFAASISARWSKARPFATSRRSTLAASQGTEALLTAAGRSESLLVAAGTALLMRWSKFVRRQHAVAIAAKAFERRGSVADFVRRGAVIVVGVERLDNRIRRRAALLATARTAKLPASSGTELSTATAGAAFALLATLPAGTKLSEATLAGTLLSSRTAAPTGWLRPGEIGCQHQGQQTCGQ